jgi:hypothetical protein
LLGIGQSTTAVYLIGISSNTFAMSGDAESQSQDKTRNNNSFVFSEIYRHPSMLKPTTNKKGVTKCNITKPATLDCSHSWIDYKSHFDACTTFNNWSDREKGLYLAVSLQGAAQGVLGNVSSETGRQYDLLVGLEKRFAPPNQTALSCLIEREAPESIRYLELGQAIRGLAGLAYPSAPMEVRETLGKEGFIDALVDSDK